MSENQQADLFVFNGKIVTVDPAFSLAEALAVKNGKIAAVGSRAEVENLVGPSTTKMDLGGMTLVPGINESHMHVPFFGATRPPLSLDLTFPAVQNIGGIVAALAEKVKNTPSGEWIRGFGWDQSSLEECRNDPSKLPRKGDLDAVSPDHPVAFTDFSCHTLLVNSKALKIAGITKDTPNPPSGEMERDENGEPTGIFKEPGAQALVSAHVPLLTREEKRTALETAFKHLTAQGVTSATDAAIGPGGETFLYGVMSADFVNIYSEMLSEGALPLRIAVLLLLGDYGALTYEDLKKGLETFPVPKSADPTRLQFPGVKIFADGIPLTYTSWMNVPYVSGDMGHGRSVIPGETDEDQWNSLVEMVRLVHGYGYQIGLHATGDRSIDAAAEGFARALAEKPGDPRHYIIHGDFVSPETCRRLAGIKCGLAMQPTIEAMISDFEPAVVGEERAAYEWPMRTVLDAGVNLTSNSDAPVTYPQWRLGVENAVLRESLVSGTVSGPEQCISVSEALQTYTINGAWQDHMESVKGSIEVGKAADFCVIDKDILSVDPHEIKETKVVRTVMGGTTVFEA